MPMRPDSSTSAIDSLGDAPGPKWGSVVHISDKDAKQVLLVKAIESADGERLLTQTQRHAATELLWAGLPGNPKGLTDAEWTRKILLPRAQRLLDEAAAKNPHLRTVLEPSLLRRLTVAGVFGFAFFVGVLADHLPNSERINLLATPLAAIVVWNWGVIAVAVLSFVIPNAAAPGRLVRQLLADTLPLILSRELRSRMWLAAVVRRYWQLRIDAAAPLLQARLSAVLHLSAVALTIGAMLSITWGALRQEYQVGWSSTLCKDECVYVVQSAFFYPTLPLAEVIGAQPFSRDDVRRLHRWEAPASDDGERWFRLTTALLLFTVALPRGLLAALSRWRARRLRSRCQLNLDDPYFRLIRTPPPTQPRTEAPQERRLPSSNLGWLKRRWAWVKEKLRRRSPQSH